MASAIIIDDSLHQTSAIKTVDHSITSISESYGSVTINSVLPFRIRFTTIGMQSYSSNNAPGIGIQIIGLSNWIL